MNGSKLRGPPRHMLRDTLTVELVTPGPVDPLTGAGEAVVVTTVKQDWPCSDQDQLLKRQIQQINSGVNGIPAVSNCFAPWFEWPEPTGQQTVVIRVNGRQRPLVRQGKPAELGGQGQMWVIELGPPLD